MSHQVEFRASGQTLVWDDAQDNLLDFAEAHGLVLDNACREGYCGTCKVRLLSGQVEMASQDGLEPADREQGYILPCVAVPLSDLVLDA